MQIYMPHSGVEDEEVEETHDKIQEIVEKEKKGACVILMECSSWRRRTRKSSWKIWIGRKERERRILGKFLQKECNDHWK